MKKLLLTVGAALGALIVWACWQVATQPIEFDMQDEVTLDLERLRSR